MSMYYIFFHIIKFYISNVFYVKLGMKENL
jgi:hypothetical protein